MVRHYIKHHLMVRPLYKTPFNGAKTLVRHVQSLRQTLLGARTRCQTLPVPRNMIKRGSRIVNCDAIGVVLYCGAETEIYHGLKSRRARGRSQLLFK